MSGFSYQKHAQIYDELIGAEDHLNHLGAALKKLAHWKNKTVYEAGIGTGRITEHFIQKAAQCYGFDREQHMLLQCQRKLAPYQQKLSLQIARNEALPLIAQKADIFIEGWSFGHSMLDAGAQFKQTFLNIEQQIYRNLKPQGQIILIETMGTYQETAAAPIPLLEEFYAFLEQECQYQKQVISTDYLFKDPSEAARIMGFFFGEAMAEKIRKNKKCIIPEFTGIWSKTLP